MEGVDFEENLWNTMKEIPLDISVNLGVVERIHIGKNYFAMKIEDNRVLFKEFRDVFS